MNLGKLIQEEWWKRTAALGWLSAVSAIVRYWFTGDVGSGIIELTGVLLFGSLAWQGVKRATWNPEGQARVESARNGVGEGGGKAYGIGV